MAVRTETEVEDAPDLYPRDPEKHREMVSWCNAAFTAADTARRPMYDRWVRYFKLNRAYIKEKPKGEWRSRVFIPYIFSTVEAILPRMVASLPKMVADPVSSDDVEPSKLLTRIMQVSAESGDLDTSLLQMYKQTLKYGTGIGKTYYKRITARVKVSAPAPAPEVPAMDAAGRPMMDMNGQPMTAPLAAQPPSNGNGSGYKDVVVWEGPVTDWVDIFDFWAAPESTDVQTARYTIQRVYREISYIEKKIEEGVYRWPEEMGPDEVSQLDPTSGVMRASMIGEDGAATDTTRRSVEILEYWLDDGRVITMANRKAILRVIQNPFNHGQKPYIRIVDYLNEGEFWGSGEIEYLEGLQDVANATINQRIDNVRMTMNQMVAVNVDAIEDMRDLRPRPGGIIRVNTDLPIREVIEPVNTGDVTSAAYTEAENIERLIERVSGIGNYQLGVGSPSQDTATGVQTMTESGNTKFSLKVKTAEMLGIRSMARQWGSLIQQYMSPGRELRILGPDGEWQFQPVDINALQGAVDYSVEVGSSAVTDSAMREQKMTLLQVMAGLLPQAVPQLAKDVFEAFGYRNLNAYLGPDAQMAGMAQMQMQQQMSPGAPAAQAGPPSGPPPSGPPPQGQEASPGLDPQTMQLLAQVAQQLGMPAPQTPQDFMAIMQVLQQMQAQQPQGQPQVQPQTQFSYQLRPPQ